MNAVIEVEKAYNFYKDDPEFNRELTELFKKVAAEPYYEGIIGATKEELKELKEFILSLYSYSFNSFNSL